MSRKYVGDINGNFWFAIQSSDDASFFGGEETEPEYIKYHFHEEKHLEEIEEGIKQCKKILGENENKLDKFFKDNNGYNDDMVKKALKIDVTDVHELLTWYARLELGNKILECVKDEGSCDFEAEMQLLSHLAKEIQLLGLLIKINKMKKFRVFQNITQFAITIEAKNKKEAIDKAKKIRDNDLWDEYEPVYENIFYDAVITKDTFIN